jgi:hypothetical protein
MIYEQQQNPGKAVEVYRRAADNDRLREDMRMQFRRRATLLARPVK